MHAYKYAQLIWLQVYMLKSYVNIYNVVCSRYRGIMDLYSDRSWMARRKSSAQIGATAEFRAGCQVFLEYAYSHPECMNGKSQIRCPCLKCKNVNYMDRDVINYHLLVSGFMRNYEECWWAHGQRSTQFGQ